MKKQTLFGSVGKLSGLYLRSAIDFISDKWLNSAIILIVAIALVLVFFFGILFVAKYGILGIIAMLLLFILLK